MRSPVAAPAPVVPAMPSPIYTPAVLQGELPPWAHPTPSPSLMMRCPQEGQSFSAASGVPASSTESPVISPELLWGVCMPYIHQMVEALHQAMQREIRAKLMPVGRTDRSPLVPAREAAMAPGLPATASPHPPERASPFHSLFNPVPRSRDAGPGHRALARKPKCSDEPLREESGNLSDLEQPPSARGASPSSETRARGEFGRKPASPPTDTLDDAPQGTCFSTGMPSRVTLVPSGTPSRGSSSQGTSPLLQGTEPAFGQKQACLEQPWQAAPVGPGPIYIQVSEQQPGQGWRDPQPASSVGNARGTRAPAMMLDQAREEAAGPPAEAGAGAGEGDDLDGEKSVMVCRHWKSKGWCRMEDKCKFMHPDHKRGSSVRKRGVKGSTAAGGGSGAGAGADADTPPAGKSARSSRRSGRGKRGSGSSATSAVVDANGLPPQAVAPGLVQSGSAAAASAGAAVATGPPC